jgi:LEA14-like dessication related protein
MNRRLMFLVVLAFLVVGCAGLTLREPLHVSIAGIEPQEGQGMEARFTVKLRIQNPNDASIDFDGVSLDLDLRGMSFASGVSDQRGTVPRFGETVVTVPVTVPATSIIRQVFGLATGDRGKVDYQLHGRLGGVGLGGTRFDASGEIEIPGGLSETGK